MPTLYRIFGYYIYFWSGDGQEPVHVHIGKGRPNANDTKIWVGDRVILEHNKGKISDDDLFKLLRFIAQNKSRIISQWHEHFEE